MQPKPLLLCMYERVFFYFEFYSWNSLECALLNALPLLLNITQMFDRILYIYYTHLYYMMTHYDLDFAMMGVPCIFLEENVPRKGGKESFRCLLCLPCLLHSYYKHGRVQSPCGMFSFSGVLCHGHPDIFQGVLCGSVTSFFQHTMQMCRWRCCMTNFQVYIWS